MNQTDSSFILHPSSFQEVTDRMSKTIFTLKERPIVPLETEVFTPDVIAPLVRVVTSYGSRLPQQTGTR